MQDNYQSNQPLYSAQPVAFSLQGLKDRLCCPRVYTWVIFGLSVANFIYYISSGSVLNGLLLLISCILSFLVAWFVTQSANTGDVRKYYWALYICIGCFVAVCIENILICVLGFIGAEKIVREKYKTEDEVKAAVSFLQVFLILFCAINIGFSSITLCVLCCYKKEFDGLPLPSSEPIASPEV